MSAIPLVNLMPQGQNTDPGSAMLTDSGHQSMSSDFHSLMTQAGDTAGVPSQALQAPGNISGQAETGDGFNDLFQLLNLLFGFQSENNTRAAGSQEVHALGTTLPDNEQTANQPAPAKAFEGFISELQNMLVMFQSLVQGLSAIGREGSPGTSQGAAGATDIPAAEGAVASANPPATPPAPYQAEDQSPGNIQQVSVLETEIAASFPAAPGKSQEPMGSTASTGQPDTRETSRGITSLEYRSFSLSSGSTNRPATGVYAGDTSIGESTGDPGLINIQDFPDLSTSPLTFKMKEAFISANGAEGNPEAKIDFVSGSIQVASDQDTPVNTVNLEKISIHKTGNGMEIYGMQLSYEADQAQSSGSQQTATSQDTLIINYAVHDPAGSSQADSNLMDHQEPGGQQADPGSIYQGGSQSATAQVNGATGNLQGQAQVGENVAMQIADGISQAIKLNKNSAILHLNPPELGSVKVHLTVGHNNQIQANFITDHPETRHILEANMQHLKDNLAQNGFSLGQVNVDIGGNAFASSGGDPQGHHLTPFGDPDMWLNSDSRDATPASSTQSAQGVGTDGVHVII